MFAVIMNSMKRHRFSIEFFDNKPEAVSYLQKTWEDYFNTKLADPYSDLDEQKCFCEEEFAVIETCNGDKVWWKLI